MLCDFDKSCWKQSRLSFSQSNLRCYNFFHRFNWYFALYYFFQLFDVISTWPLSCIQCWIAIPSVWHFFVQDFELNWYAPLERNKKQQEKDKWRGINNNVIIMFSYAIRKKLCCARVFSSHVFITTAAAVVVAVIAATVATTQAAKVFRMSKR